MKLLHHYMIPFDPRTKKNHMQIAGTGPRCPKCKKPEKQYVRQGKAYDIYRTMALPFLRPKPPAPIATPVWVKYHFYMQTRRRVDRDNLKACAQDLLVEGNILKDDNSAIIKSDDGTRVFYDKERPRTEIYIYEYKEEEDAEVQALQS